MIVTNLFIYKIVFAVQILSALFTFGHNYHLKSKPYIRIPIMVIVSLLSAAFFPIFDNFSYTWYGSFITFLYIFLVCSAFMKFVFEMTWPQMFLVCVTSYTVQNMLQQIFTSSCVLLRLDENLMGSFNADLFTNADLLIILIKLLLILIIYPISYVIVDRLLITKIQKYNPKIHNETVVYVSVGALLINIILNSIFITSEDPTTILNQIVICIYDFSCCFIILVLFSIFLANKNLQENLKVSDILLTQAETKYKQSKENVDLINIKCHDLKHQIFNLGSQKTIDKGELNEIANAIGFYDKTMHTNNDALDLILMEKALICQKENINLKCYADCSRLKFMSNADIYSLFGNAVENAMEAVRKLDDDSKKTINIFVKNINEFVSITIENYFSNVIMAEDGMPLTTKKDKIYHGFGMKSIKYIVDKYNGNLDVNTDDNIFKLSILFLIEDKKDEE